MNTDKSNELDRIEDIVPVIDEPMQEALPHNRPCYLSTKDNPYNPKTQYDEWYLWDMTQGYNCCAYLDRIAKVGDAMTPIEIETEIERAIDEIVELNGGNDGIYVKIV